MSKKTIIAGIIIAGLLLSLVGMQYTDVAKANPNIWPGPTPTYVNVPNSKPPIMTIISPKNGRHLPPLILILSLTSESQSQNQTASA